MKPVAYAIVNRYGEVIVCRTSQVAAEADVLVYYPGAHVVPLVFAQEEPEGDNQ